MKVHSAFLLACCVIFTRVPVNTGNACKDIEVLRPFHPYYVQEGSNLTLRCQCSAGFSELEWVRQTPETNWMDSQIEPDELNDFLIRTLTEDPTGFVQSTLIKKELMAEDRGTYLCRDTARENTYGVWVTILKVIAEDVRPVGTEETLELKCQVTGFDTNPSSMLYIWERDGKAYQLSHLDKEVVFADKYVGSVTYITSTSLTITNPNKNDAGKYTCSFLIASDIGPQIFSETIHVYGTNLSGKAACANPSVLAVLLVILCNILVMSSPLVAS